MLFQSLIRKISRRSISAAEKRLLTPGKAKMLELPWTPGGENALQNVLDNVGLPWRMRTENIIARFGLSRHAGFDWEQSPIVPCPLGLDGLIYPLSPEPGAFFTVIRCRCRFRGKSGSRMIRLPISSMLSVSLQTFSVLLRS